MGPSDDNRRSPRSRVFLSATLEWPGNALPVLVRDLSEHGALLECRGNVEPDSEVLFRRNDLGVCGRVAWVRGSRVGITFSRPLKAQEVLCYIGRSEPRVVEAAAFRRPAVTKKGMSVEEQRWAVDLTSPGRRK